jgi:hypothetical protein
MIDIKSVLKESASDYPDFLKDYDSWESLEYILKNNPIVSVVGNNINRKLRNIVPIRDENIRHVIEHKENTSAYRHYKVRIKYFNQILYTFSIYLPNEDK